MSDYRDSLLGDIERLKIENAFLRAQFQQPRVRYVGGQFMRQNGDRIQPQIPRQRDRRGQY